MVQAFDEIRRRSKEHWDAATMARMAREFLDQHWSSEKLALADAKDVVLPGVKRWLQDKGWGQFSDLKLAEMLKSLKKLTKLIKFYLTKKKELSMTNTARLTKIWLEQEQARQLMVFFMV